MSIFEVSEGELVFRFSIFMRGGDGVVGEGEGIELIWNGSNLTYGPIGIPTGPLRGPLGPISDFSDFGPLGPPRNFLENFRGAALRAGCAYRTKETWPYVRMKVSCPETRMNCMILGS